MAVSIASSSWSWRGCIYRILRKRFRKWSLRRFRRNITRYDHDGTQWAVGEYESVRQRLRGLFRVSWCHWRWSFPTSAILWSHQYSTFWPIDYVASTAKLWSWWRRQSDYHRRQSIDLADDRRKQRCTKFWERRYWKCYRDARYLAEFIDVLKCRCARVSRQCRLG